ncbi:MAG: ATP-binding protein [Boseongicola sp.]|nr:ATP-binding protein [Boseongicola sp.]
MARPDDLKRENDALRKRIAMLNAAILRINASLDLDTVLEEVVESARALTGARWGVIATVDEAGAPLDFVFSGFTAEEREDLLAWPESVRLFEHFRQLPGPLRVDDLSGYVRALGIEPAPAFSRTFQGTPMRHRDADVGSFFLADKANGEAFTREDEEALTLFAFQAASAIANARIHRDERSARADLEALIETSPVGVVVFDAKSGRPVSFNREARRIVEGLRMPASQPEDLLEVVSFSRADGREISLAEFPIAQHLGAAKTVRAEEVVLSVPDGRSVRMLVNATPINAEDGTVTSVVVTMQDLAPLDEIERLRTEFLGLVGHELREPLAAIRGSAVTLLDDAAALDPAEMREFHRIIVEQSGHMRGLIGDLLDAGRIDTGTLSVSPEPSEVSDLVERARDTFIGGGGRHGIIVDLPVGLARAMADRRRIVQVLNNLFANAARHAPESSPIRVSALREDSHVAVAVTDEGRGLAPELLARFFDKHAKDGSKAGHGLGLAICKGLVEAHGGRIRAESDGPGRGTTVTFTLPVAGEADTRTRAEQIPKPQPAERARILAVDDDPHVLRSVRDTLSAAGYAPLVTGEPGQIARIIRNEKPRLVLLDLILPGQDGIELMQEVPELSDLPVIFISGYGRDETVAAALEAGAADYIVKPFSPTELVARVRAALRRHETPEPLVLGALAIDFDRRRVTVGGEAVALTATEHELLRVLALDAGRVVTYDTLLRRVWNGRDSADTNLVRIFVRTLRRKLGDNAANPTWIFNERGVGYRMAEPGRE